jgi:hypothetical protein
MVRNLHTDCWQTSSCTYQVPNMQDYLLIFLVARCSVNRIFARYVIRSLYGPKMYPRQRLAPPLASENHLEAFLAPKIYQPNPPEAHGQGGARATYRSSSFRLDDICGLSRTNNPALSNEEILERLQEYGLILNLEKCQFGSYSVEDKAHDFSAGWWGE